MSPGIWEMISQGPQGMLVAIPTTGLVTIDWALELRGLALPVGAQVKCWRGLPVDVARNRLVKDAREMNAKYIFMLDSDQYPERNTAIQEMLSLQLPIVSGLYFSKKQCAAMWVATPDRQSFQAIAQYPENALIEVDVVGAGCLLIDMRVFDHLQYPWFVWEIDDPAIQAGKFSEDFHWCIAARKAGYKIMVHTGIRWFHEQMIPWSAKGQVMQRT